MKTTLIGLVLGLLIGFTIGAFMYRTGQSPTDLTQRWSPELRELAGHSWATNAHVYRIGKINIIAPADDTRGAMNIMLGAHPFAGIYIMDSDTNGFPDHVVIADAARRNVSVDYDSDTELFTAIGFSTGVDSSSISYQDRNVDGQYELAFGPGKEIRVWIEGQWHPVVMSNDLQLVRKDGHLFPVTHSNHVWSIDEEGRVSVTD